MGEEPQQRCDSHRGAFRVLHRVRLRGDLGEHEEQRDFQHGAHEHGDRTELLEQHPDEGGGRELADEQDQEDRVQGSRRVLQHLHELLGAAVAVLLQRHRTDPAHLGEGRLGEREHG